MSIIALLCLLFGVAAALLLVLFFLQRRQLTALEEVSQQVQRTAIGGSLKSRIELHTDQPELAALVTAVNHLLARAAAAVENVPRNGAPIDALGDRVHEAVMIHAEKIRYANPQFAQLLGSSVEALLGRRLEDLVPPEYAELVGDNLRRRLAGEATAERYEIELSDAQGQSSRLELSSWPIEHYGERALLVVGVEVLPTQTMQALQSPERRSKARLALESVPEALFTTDANGQVEYLNAAAIRLLGMDSAAAGGKAIEDVVRVVEESDRKLLGEPVRQALGAGAPLNLARRALMIRAASGERLVELSAAPIRIDTGESMGAVVLLHDVTEVRGLARQMSYQATHDALTGLINRREFEHRLEGAMDTAHRGDSGHVLCYLDLDRFKTINDSSGHVAGDAMLREVANRGAHRRG
jgi:PAS domain S-box-containing protein